MVVVMAVVGFVEHVGAAGGVEYPVGAGGGEGAVGCEVEGPAAFVDEMVVAFTLPDRKVSVRCWRLRLIP
jgi:hypothetical protein